MSGQSSHSSGDEDSSSDKAGKNSDRDEKHKELRFDLAHARSIRRIRQELESWSPLTESQIIAQKFLKPIVCHAGYDVNGVKEAIAWANSVKLSGHFEIIDVTTNKQPPGIPPVVYKGKLREWGTHIWGGNNYVLDFSDFKDEGLYWIQVKVNETDEVATSYVFEIKRDFYLDLALKAAKWFYYQRCGVEIPGWHKACHTKDAIILEDGTKIDATGGWHDAGDYGKWIGSGASGIWALVTFAELLLEEGYEDKAREVLEEALWEGEYFCKVYYKKLRTFLQTFSSTENFPLSKEFPPLENVCIWLGSPEKEPPRIVTIQKSLGLYPPSLMFRAHVAMSLAKLGRVISKYDERASEKYIKIANEVYNYVLRSKPSGRDLERYLYLESRKLLLAIELYKCLGEEEYLRMSEELVEGILALQSDEGYFYLDKGKSSRYLHSDYHLIALYEFIELNKNKDLRKKSIEAFKKWAEYLEPLARLSPFGQVGTLDENNVPRNLEGRRPTNRLFGAYAWAFATASILLHEPKYLRIAEHQLQWILGFNPRDVSMMAGVGGGPGCYHHRYCFIEGHEDGVVPGGVINGIVGGNGNFFDVGDFRTGNFVVSDNLPVDYPIIDTDVWGWTYAYLTNEYWVINNAWFIMGATQVHRALKTLRREYDAYLRALQSK